MLKFSRMAVVLTAALSLAAASIPTKAEAFGFLLAPALFGSALLGAGAFSGGGYGGAIMLTEGAVTLTVGMAAAVEFRLRLRLHRRAVTTAGVAAVGMAAVGMVAGKAIEYQVCMRSPHRLLTMRRIRSCFHSSSTSDTVGALSGIPTASRRMAGGALHPPERPNL